jgi:hypothetical protein
MPKPVPGAQDMRSCASDRRYATMAAISRDDRENPVKTLAIAMGVLAIAGGAAEAAEPPVSKATCDAALTSEVKRLEDGFSRTRDAWEKSVDQRFLDHKELTAHQMDAARTTFNSAVMELSSEHLRAVALPGMYRMMLAIPRYDLSVCEKPADMRTMGDQAIAGFLMKLTVLLPLIETSVDAAKRDDQP